ncbi:MarR family transcriptional regulator [Rhodocytophaga rosea]|uniref:MarR family transcriptional regulator n=1 Tax=Rhodocytophaga rosea TaxID=2704465 RepID=A0A6C0GEY6_9BACT|nr:MarR family transcriptional regulator [Rhodocytophaga rosea]QHT66302.1 MarR family transcriptional regulator [Rhodocytophaga rosea]
MKIEEEIKQDKFTSEFEKTSVNILFTSSWLHSLLSSALKPYGISVQQYNVLRILKGQCSKPAMLGLIQERMMDKMSNATRLVDKLIEKGLVDRKQCPMNRRQVDIVITKEGLALIEKIQPALNKIDHSFGINDEEARILNQLLDKFRS